MRNIDAASMTSPLELDFMIFEKVHTLDFETCYDKAVFRMGLNLQKGRSVKESSILNLEPMVCYTHHLRNEQNPNIIGIIDVNDLHIVMNLFDKDLSYWRSLEEPYEGAKESLKLYFQFEKESLKSQIFLDPFNYSKDYIDIEPKAPDYTKERVYDPLNVSPHLIKWPKKEPKKEIESEEEQEEQTTQEDELPKNDKKE